MRRVLVSLAFASLGLSAHGQIAPATSGLPSNSFITAINSAVTLSPTPVTAFSTFNVGPINSVSYDASHRYTTNSGGTTGWINIHFTFTGSGLTAGDYRLAFIVTNVGDTSYASGLAVDAVTSTNVVIANTSTNFAQGFETGTNALPSDWTLTNSGTRGIVSTNVTGFSTADSSSRFAFIDTNGSSVSTSAIGGTTGTILLSPNFSLTGGSTLDMKVAFFSNDGSPYLDFALVQLFAAAATPLSSVPAATLFTAIAPSAVPEPSTVALLMGCGTLAAAYWWRRRTAGVRTS